MNLCPCDYQHEMITAIIGILILAVTCLGCTIDNNDEQLKQMKLENENMKNLIYQSFDKVFTKALKNGNDYDEDND